MLIILVSCFGLAALGLLGTATWMYFNQKQKVDRESKTQVALYCLEFIFGDL
jgi:predicted ribosomally synthesized peptide with SipW-like signal peptide